MQAPPRRAPTGVLFDSSLDAIEHVLALALLLGADAQRVARVVALSTSRSNLHTAACLDVIARFFAGERRGTPARGARPVGMPAGDGGTARHDLPPMLAAVLDKTAANGDRVYPRHINRPNDAADPVAVIRNALSAQVDGSAAVVLAGEPANLVSLLSFPDGRAWTASKARLLSIAAGRFGGEAPPDPLVAAHVTAFRRLLAEWPSPIVMAGLELDDLVRFPASSIETRFAWASDHPVVDAYRAGGRMPYDASARTLAAALHAAAGDESPFLLSEPGEVTVLDDGRMRFAPAASGRHRYLSIEPGRKDQIQETFVQLASAQPAASARPGGPPAASASPRGVTLLSAVALAVSLAAWSPQPLKGQSADFDTDVRPILQGTCLQCHNAQQSSGGLSLAPLTSPDGLRTERELWDRVLRRLRIGDMPPPGVARPDAVRLGAMVAHVERALARADAADAGDPGRMTAHRLNRAEYANTIRDLLGVAFAAEKYFPADDSGDGFDTMGDVLTVSPLLMERYVAAAEQIASWALSTAIPAKPLEAAYLARERRIRRLDRSTIEAEHRIDFAGEYVVRFGLPGERPPVDGKDAAPVVLGLWANGHLIASKTVETRPSGLVYFDPYSEADVRVYLTEGDYVFRAGFIGDDFVRTLSDADAYNRRRNKFLDSIVFVGPYPSATPKPARTRLLSCDPATGRACVERIVANLARRAYRRPVTRSEVAALMRFVDRARAEGESFEDGLEVAVQAMLVSPHFLFRIERDPDPRDASRVHRLSPYELASRLSYFLWSSMPDEALFEAAAAGRLHEPGVLRAQVDRMLADSRAAAFAENFAGQWLETRNLDTVRPDPERFREWGPELRDAMKAETRLFFEHVLRENRPISDFLNADYTFLNERLARHYGIAGVSGPEFRRVVVATDQRGGVLSHGAVLTVSSYPTRTSPVIRGKYVLQNILGIPPAPPPPDVPSIDAEGVGAVRSMRDELERHRSNPACASCHRNMDPLGFGLENYDAIGRWRDADGAFAVDASGTLPDGQRFATAGEMRARLASQLPQFSRTLSERMLTYALRRALQPYDRREIERIRRAVEADGYRFRRMVHEIVLSLPFGSRRGEAMARSR